MPSRLKTYDKGTGPQLQDYPVPPPFPSKNPSTPDPVAAQQMRTILENLTNLINSPASIGDTDPELLKRIELLKSLGYSLEEAILLANSGADTMDPLGVLKFLSQNGSGGGGGRTLFASEDALNQAQTRLALANASGQELQNSIIGGGSRLVAGPNGLLIDQLTGQTVDPTSIGLGRDDFNFRSGPQFQENIRQFDETNATSRRGQDISLAQSEASNLLAAQRLGLDTQTQLGQLGLDRSRFMADVLRNPSDALARLYMQRGGVSPTAFISQADILNSFNQGVANTSAAASALSSSLANDLASKYNGVKNPTQPAPVSNPTATLVPPISYYDPGPKGGGAYVGELTPEIKAALDKYGAGGYAGGGYTNDKVFIGDEKGHELYFNPTGAPIAIMPHDQTKELVSSDGKIKGYEDGTSAGPRTKLKAYPTGGFLNSLREVMAPEMDAFTNAMRSANADIRENPLNYVAAGGANWIGKGLPQTAEQAARFAEMEALRQGPRNLREAWDAFKKASYSHGDLRASATRNPNIPQQLVQDAKLRMDEAKRIFDNMGGDSALKALDNPNSYDARRAIMNEISDTQMDIEDIKAAIQKATDSKVIGALGKQLDYLEGKLQSAIEDIGIHAKMRELQGPNAPQLIKPGKDISTYATGTYYGQYAPGNINLNNPSYSTSSDPTYGTAYYNGDAPGGRVETQDQYRTRLSNVAAQNGYSISGWSSGGTPSYTPITTATNSTPSVTQQSLIQLAEQALSPGGRSVVEGTTPAPFNIPGLASPTLMSFNRISPAERENLNTYLATKFNSTIEDLMFQLQKRYGTSQSRLARMSI